MGSGPKGTVPADAEAVCLGVGVAVGVNDDEATGPGEWDAVDDIGASVGTNVGGCASAQPMIARPRLSDEPNPRKVLPGDVVAMSSTSAMWDTFNSHGAAARGFDPRIDSTRVRSAA